MAETSVPELFQQVFAKDGDLAYADDYLEALRSNLRAAGSARFRAIVAAVTAAAAFQIIVARQAKDTIEIAGLSISDPKYAMAALPVVFAFQVSIFALNEVWGRVLVVAHRAVMHAAHPAMYNAGVDWLERPIEAVVPSADRARAITALHGEPARGDDLFHGHGESAGILALGAAAAAWLGYAIIRNFATRPHHLGTSLASLAVVLFVICFRAAPPVIAYRGARSYLIDGAPVQPRP
jgi:hypothetical protein